MEPRPRVFRRPAPAALRTSSTGGRGPRSLPEQWEAAQPLPGKFALARILVPPGVPYEQAVARFRPYDRMQAPREDMRRDVVRLIRQVTEAGADAFILVNNRSEGCAPLTIRALAEQLGIPLPEQPPRSLFD